MATLPQSRWQRSGTGLRGHNSEKAFQGYTLFSPGASDGEIYLIDMEGEIAQAWNMPYPPGYPKLTDEGTILYVGTTPDTPYDFMMNRGWKTGLFLEADWRGSILWEVRQADSHHDAIKLANGNVLLVCLERLPDEIAARVAGGKPGTEFNGQEMYADYLVEMTIDGEVVWEWHCVDHLEPEDYPLTSTKMDRTEWTHCNSVEELPDGNLLVSFRQTSTVAIIDRATGKFIWEIGPPTVAQQHAPTLLENGNILILDNGTERVDSHLPYSRVIEVDLQTNEIVWSYQQPSEFFASFISNAQRLPNGNTLVNDGPCGRFFEVTKDGEVVWEYISPFFALAPDNPDGPPTNRVFRCYRYSPEMITRARGSD